MRAEMSRGMRSTPGIMRDVIRAGQDYVEPVPFCVSVIGIYVFVRVAAVVYVVSFTNVETGAHALVSFCAMLLFALPLTSLTLRGLARLCGLRSLVGPTTKLATSTA
jgi:hypothetical protein